jgi:hypothetical protein
MVQYTMLKTKAIELLGGSAASAAEAIGVTYQAVVKWPDDLPARIVDRVIAALVKQKRPVPKELLVTQEAKAI